MKLTDDYTLKREIIRFFKLINGSIAIGYIALLVYGIVKLIGVFV